MNRNQSFSEPPLPRDLRRSFFHAESFDFIHLKLDDTDEKEVYDILYLGKQKWLHK